MARSFVVASGDVATYSGAAIIATPLTMVAWINPTTLAANGSLCLCDNSTTNRFAIVHDASGHIAARVQNSGGTSDSTSAGTMSTGTWYHAGAIFRSGTDRQGYFNGTPATVNNTSRAPTGINTALVGSAAGTKFNGLVAEAAMWNVPLDDAEMAELAKGFSPLLIRPANLIHYWQLDGRKSPEIDLRGRAPLTLTGTAYADHPSIIKPFRGPYRQPRRIVTSGFKAAWARGANVVIGAGAR